VYLTYIQQVFGAPATSFASSRGVVQEILA
jgi:hypothetical protein